MSWSRNQGVSDCTGSVKVVGSETFQVNGRREEREWKTRLST